MIVKCSYCDRLMRIDDKAVTWGRDFKARCPHCRAIGLVRLEAIPKAENWSGNEAPVGPGLSAHDIGRKVGHADEEPDYSQDFSFPAEKTQAVHVGPPARWWVKAIVWVALSLGVISFFAVLVNLVLPGPGK